LTATPIEDAQVVYEPDPDFAGMFAYWPGALTNEDGWEGASAKINKNMGSQDARRTDASARGRERRRTRRAFTRGLDARQLRYATWPAQLVWTHA
jgi:hypothetical protein